ncbi:MAG: PAS domain S-box protein, partial [Bacteroidota bacterium]
ASSTPAAVFIYQNENFRYVNPAAETLTGYPADELLRKKFWEVVHPDFQDLVKERGLARQKGASLPPRYEFKIVTKTGEERWIDFTATRIEYGGLQAALGTAFDITEQRKAVEKIRESEQRYRLLAEHTTDMIARLSRTGIILYVSPAVEHLLGYPADAIIGKNALEYIHADDRGTMRGSFESVLTTGKPTMARYRLLHVNGTHRWFETTVTAGPSDPISKNIELVTISRDIDDRKRSEDQLREVSRFNEQIISSAGQGIVVCDLDLRFVVWNRFMENLTGFPSGRVVGSAATELFPGIGAQGIPALLHKALKGERTQSPDMPFALPQTGRSGWVNTTFQPLRDSAGTVIGVIGVVNDVAERRRTEEQLRTSEQRYREFFEEDLSGVFISKPDGTLLDCNPTYARMLGFSSVDEAIATNTYAMYERRSDRDKYLELLRKEKRLMNYERELVGKGGRRITVIANITGEFDRQGSLQRIRGYLLDITERKKLEEDLRHSQKMESIGTLAGGIAHDFNNILGIILGYASRLAKGFDETRYMKNVDAIIKATERGAGLVRQLLTFARKSADVREPLSLNEAVEEIQKLLKVTFPKSIEFSLSLDPGVPQIVGDGNQIHQGLLNLCVNARDAMPDGGTLSLSTAVIPGPEVRSGFPEAIHSSYVRISVADTGIGIDAPVRERMFEPFFSTKPRGRGTGLGLALVYGIMKSHSGYIHTESTPGKGSVFSLFFPIPGAGSTAETSVPQTTGETTGGGETLLLVEDEEMLLDLLSSLLQTRGYTILTATDGEEAVNIYRNNHEKISLVLSDMGLPKLGGWEAFQQMKSINPGVKAILASGYLDPNLRFEMIAAGAQDFIQKPYVPDKILAKIREIIDAGRDN